MRKISPIAIVREKFGVQVFMAIAALVFLLSVLSMVLLSRVQYSTLISELENSGTLIAQMLAHQVRIGLFAENSAMLQSPMESPFQNEMVLNVSLFDPQGRVVAEKNQGGEALEPVVLSGPGILDLVGRAVQFPAVFHVEDKVVVWASVVMGDSFLVEDLPYAVGEVPEGGGAPIGYVRVTLGKKLLQEQLRSTLLKTTFLGVVILAIGAIISFFLAKHIHRPIKQLTQSVVNFGRAGRFEPFPVKSHNEIGQLAVAFQTLIQSLDGHVRREVETAKELAHNRNLAQLGVASSKVTHEVGNLLNNIGMVLPALKAEPLSANGQKRIALLTKEAARLRIFISDFLQFAGKPVLQMRTVSLMPMLQDILAALRDRACRDGIELVLDWPESIPPVTADHRMLHLALENLVANALAALGKGGKVAIIGRVEGEQLVIAVEDTGTGIEPALLELVFDPFFTTKGEKGTGLGLSIVKGIVQGHGGTVGCESQPGKKTRFVIRLPMLPRDGYEPADDCPEKDGPAC